MNPVPVYWEMRNELDPEPEITERNMNYSNLSRVTSSWKASARRYLFEAIIIREFSELEQEVEDYVGNEVVTLMISFQYIAVSREQGKEASSLVFRLLSKVPNLRHFTLNEPPFTSFSPLDSVSIRQPGSTPFFPCLRTLKLTARTKVHSLLSDLLAASAHGITRLEYHGDITAVEQSAEGVEEGVVEEIVEKYEPLDFGGNLRSLLYDFSSVSSSAPARRSDVESFAGLEEMEIRKDFLRNDMERFCQVVGPTLRKLIIKGKTEPIFLHLSHLTHLSTLRLCSEVFGDTLFALCNLPPALTYLKLDHHDDIGLMLEFWRQNPGRLLSTLKEISIRRSHLDSPLEDFPPVDTIQLSWDYFLLLTLRATTGKLKFKNLAVWFAPGAAKEIEEIRVERRRLGVQLEVRETYDF